MTICFSIRELALDPQASSRWIKRGTLALAVSWAPLLTYLAFEKLNGATVVSPIGLGLLMLAGTAICLACLAIGGWIFFRDDR